MEIYSSDFLGKERDLGSWLSQQVSFNANYVMIQLMRMLQESSWRNHQTTAERCFKGIAHPKMCIWSSSPSCHSKPTWLSFFCRTKDILKDIQCNSVGSKITSPTCIVWTFFELWRLFLNYPFKGQYVKHCWFYQSLSNMLFLWYWQTLYLY